MSDFNDDNAKLDAAIKANVDAITAEAAARAASVTALTEKAGMQLLDTQSVPASTGDWSVELGAVDWSAWSTVRVVCVPVLSADGRYDLSISGQTCATSSKGACQIHLHPSFRTDLPAAGTCWAPGTVPASFIAGSFQSATIRPLVPGRDSGTRNHRLDLGNEIRTNAPLLPERGACCLSAEAL